MSLYESHTIDLTITVLDTATIFEGPESIYRYDLPGTAVVEGWALSGVMEQAQKLLPAQWPEVSIAVVADSSGGPMSHEAVKIIRRQLQVHNVTLVDREPVAVGATYDEPPQREQRELRDETEIIRPALEEETLLSRLLDNKGLMAIIAGVVVVAIMLVWLLLRGATQQQQEAVAGTVSIAATPGVTTPAVTTAAQTPTTSSSAPAHQSVEAGGLRVLLPEGFSHTEEDGLVTATGQDPNLRILMVMDPLYAVPANALFAEVRAQIDSDETLSDPHEANGRLSYIEKPGDDSEVKWTTWVEDDQQISLGCHTREEPSMAQRAACRMASESIETVPER
ncbi:type VII secretion-associated protein [Corynebacterium sp. J010B-136]|uniref:type VII secretion-associated protein n=1 Tax=Corynebacterium sp. J010B-136 TaxID=2099401 RepID=UPI000CF931F4|nr:type VII secretion-associated protein [Corynebacterium sp. J010B-136]PQM75522.1 type VII secretion-associated protein [Corynebacterium sp. J010B-136]